MKRTIWKKTSFIANWFLQKVFNMLSSGGRLNVRIKNNNSTFENNFDLNFFSQKKSSLFWFSISKEVNFVLDSNSISFMRKICLKLNSTKLFWLPTFIYEVTKKRLNFSMRNRNMSKRLFWELGVQAYEFRNPTKFESWES